MENQQEEVSPQDLLLEALRKNNLQAFQLHLSNPRVDPRFFYGKPYYATCLQIASRRPYGAEYIRLLLKNKRVKPYVNEIIPEPVHDAARHGYSKVLQALLDDKRTKANAIDSKGRTALHYVCTYVTAQSVRGHLECVRLLMERFAPDDVNRTDWRGFSAIHTAVRTTPAASSPRPSAKTVFDAPPVSGAVDENIDARCQIIRMILNLGRDVLDLDTVRALGRTAREDILRFFPELEKYLPTGTDAMRVDSHLPLSTAIRDGHIQIFRALLQETDPDGQPRLDPNHWFGSPLHATCLELACKKHNGEDFVEALLMAGADPNTANKIDEKFPIHVACEKAHYKQIKVLFEYCDKTDPNSTDKYGNTALHYAVDKIKTEKHLKENMKQCLDILLDQQRTDVNIRNSEDLTALMIALEHKNKSVVERFLEAKPESLEICAKYKDKEVREEIITLFPDLIDKVSLCRTPPSHQAENEWFRLLQTEQEELFAERLDKTKPLNPSFFTMNDKTHTLLQRAAYYGMAKAVTSLLKNGADPNETFDGNLAPPVVLACRHRQWEVVKIFLEDDNLDVNASDVKGNTALHYAARDHLETVIYLLHRGADMSIPNKLGKTALGKEQVQKLLDQCVCSNKMNPLEEDYKIILDYRLLAPGRIVETRNETYVPVDDDEADGPEDLISEMDFLHMMSKSDELSTLLDHPVVFSFLELKWNRVKHLAYINLGVYVTFMMFLNIYITTNDFLNFNAKNSLSECIYSGMAAIALIASVLLWILLLFREFVQCALDKRKYFRTFDNYLDISILIFSIIALFLPIFFQNYSIINFVNVVTIMLSCTELLVLLGRISHFAKYIEMLKVVLQNYFFPLVSYCIIVFAFGLSFRTLFHNGKGRTVTENDKEDPEESENISNDFGTWYMAIVKSLVMMTGELDFDSYPDRSFLSVILFVLFVLLVTVVLLNLLIGLAVSDTQKIEDMAQRLRLQTRTEIVKYAENMFVNMHNSKLLKSRYVPCTWRSKLKMMMRRSLLFPYRGITDSGSHRREGIVKPNRSAEVIIHGGETDNRHNLDRDLLDRATNIISRRSGQSVPAEARPPASLEEVNTKLDRINELLTGKGNVVAGVAELEAKLESVLRLLERDEGTRLEGAPSQDSVFRDRRFSSIVSD